MVGWQRSNPIVADGLISIQLERHSDQYSLISAENPFTHDKRVSLSYEDLYGVYFVRLVVHTVDFYDSHVMAIDGKGVIGTAGHIDNAEAIAEWS